MDSKRGPTSIFLTLCRSFISGGDVRIEKDPAMTDLAKEARRLSVQGRQSPEDSRGKRSSISSGTRAAPSARNGGIRRPSDGLSGSRSPRLGSGVGARRQSDGLNGGPGHHLSSRRQSDSPVGFVGRRTPDSGSRRGSEALERKNSADGDHDIERRRLSEAGMRRPSSAEPVLNEDTSSLMVGMPVWVDGRLHGRIAFLGSVHFTKGEVAGVHLESPAGKNNGSVGGTMYFQCEPKHGIFARLHRLTREPLIYEDGEDNYED